MGYFLRLIYLSISNSFQGNMLCAETDTKHDAGYANLVGLNTNNDESLTPDELICFQWQIACGMVRDLYSLELSKTLKSDIFTALDNKDKKTKF